jgi:YD repeat-containing protein
MSNSHKGSAKITLLIVVIVLLVIMFSGYIYLRVRNNLRTAQNNDDRFNQLIAQRKAAEILNPPSGFLVPNKIPSGYVLVSSYFSSSSTNWSYRAQKTDQFGSYASYLQFGEGNKQSYDDYVKTETESKVQVVRDIDDFVFNGSKGAILGDYSSQNVFLHSTSTAEYWLAYDHNGRLLIIHTTDGLTLTPPVLISWLKAATQAP